MIDENGKRRNSVPRSDKGISKGSYAPTPEETPKGICECGCGKPTPITNYTNRRTRHFKGYPSPILRGHIPGIKQGSDSHKWKGGRRISRGYAFLYLPGDPRADSKGYIPEHRVVWEESNGRTLNSWEHVHHINGVKDDNRPENLVALTRSEHSKAHGWNPGQYQDTEDRKQNGRKGADARWHKSS